MAEKKVAIITGAAQGIGLASVEKFAKEGWSVAAADLKKEELDKEVARLKKEGFDVEGYELDVTNFEQGKKVVDEVISHFGRIDALFNNAGIIGHRGNVLNFDPELIKQATNVNVFGTLYMTQHVAKYFVKNHVKGSIVNVSSIAAELAEWSPFGYHISKWGVKGVTRSTAFQLGSYGIRVNAVAPGSTKTPMSKIDWSNPEISKTVEKNTLLKKWLEPSEIANAAYFLSSDQASGITGHILLVDAGYTITKEDNAKNIYGE